MRQVCIAVLAVVAMFALSNRASAENSTVLTPGMSATSERVPPVSVHTGNEGDAHHHKSDHNLKPGFGGWGGPTLTLMFPRASSFSPMTDALGISAFPSEMFIIGGMGGGQLGPHFRIGGGGAGGTLYTSGDVLGVRRSAVLTIGYGGMVLYGMVPLGAKIDLYGKALLGAGGLTISARGDDVQDNFEESVGFFAWQPALGIAYHPLKFMSIELEAAYFGMMLPQTKIAGQEVITEGLAGGPMVQLNILFGGVYRPK